MKKEAGGVCPARISQTSVNGIYRPFSTMYCSRPATHSIEGLRG
jgi:hypothetical protein